MKCHYEILDVSRDADSGEIKSAYRKLALKWHPDKNLNNTEHAKEQFQLVQQAYEVLSDRQERAWYDKHREQILRGSNSEFQDNSLDVFPYFTTTCFKSYADDEKGFYTVYRNVFDQIIKEDIEFMEDKEEYKNIPTFGDSQSSYDEVVGPFYAYWSSYCTRKTYVWLDPYSFSEILNRKQIKAIDKENKKVRLQAKKERNEEVRNLVAFVRKRDKRVQEHTRKLDAKILENRQKQEELSKQKRLERKKQINDSGFQAEWTKFDNVKSELEEIEKQLANEFGEDLSNSEDEQIADDLYCVACNKYFKTPKALENHELSKKHKENLEILIATMNEEEENVEHILSEYDSQDEELIESENLEEATKLESNEDKYVNSHEGTKKKKKKGRNVLSVENEETSHFDIDITKLSSDDNCNFQESTTKPKKKNKKQDRQKPVLESVVLENENTEQRSQNSKKKRQNKKEKINNEAIDVNHCCITCQSSYPSKNKLFEHLQKAGHGVYIPNKSKSVK